MCFLKVFFGSSMKSKLARNRMEEGDGLETFIVDENIAWVRLVKWI